MGSKRFCLGRWNDGVVLRALRGLRVARVMVPMAMPKRIFVRPLTLGHAIACYLDVELKFVRIHLGISARKTANTFPAITELVALLEKPASTAMFENMRLAVLRRAAAVHAQKPADISKSAANHT
ncbi:hypothetical protein [Xanthomonas citri]|uniref:Uncharacterized protein n=2 Tax=Xanthomonas TaxID=338 RepID=A0A7Z7NGA1_XANCH|nr:hypothetical protein [Xanthomonas citri]UZB07179.1 hypothetical protein OM953_16525 [Xanthomonas citri pv. fuscans]SON94076.1 conserved hypothetical protein [Xanthomonas citri pv. fuscans]SOO23667.1 conserved hypothetical protein [Xanthomonas phaseoli pv. phaseoli]